MRAALVLLLQIPNAGRDARRAIFRHVASPLILFLEDYIFRRRVAIYEYVRVLWATNRLQRALVIAQFTNGRNRSRDRQQFNIRCLDICDTTGRR